MGTNLPTKNPCGSTYDSNAGLDEPTRELLDKIPDLDRSVLVCIREEGHVGSHIACREVHVSIWDDEMFFDYYAPDGFGASVQMPR